MNDERLSLRRRLREHDTQWWSGARLMIHSSGPGHDSFSARQNNDFHHEVHQTEDMIGGSAKSTL